MSNEHLVSKSEQNVTRRVELLRTKTFMHSLANELGVPHTGYQLEHVFEGNKIRGKLDGTLVRSHKYDRFFAGKTMVGPATLNIIKKHSNVKQSLSIYNSAFWKALMPAKPDSDAYWIKFFTQQRPSLQLISLVEDDHNRITLKHSNRYTEGKLLRECDLEGVACAIGIFRAQRPTLLLGNIRSVPKALAKMLGWVFMNSAFDQVRDDIVDLLHLEYNVMNADIGIYEQNFISRVAYRIDVLVDKNRKYLQLLCDYGFSKAWMKNKKKVIALSEQADKALIYQQLEAYSSNKKAPPKPYPDYKDYTWLLEKVFA